MEPSASHGMTASACALWLATLAKMGFCRMWFTELMAESWLRRSHDAGRPQTRPPQTLPDLRPAVSAAVRRIAWDHGAGAGARCPRHAQRPRAHFTGNRAR